MNLEHDQGYVIGLGCIAPMRIYLPFQLADNLMGGFMGIVTNDRP